MTRRLLSKRGNTLLIVGGLCLAAVGLALLLIRGGDEKKPAKPAAAGKSVPAQPCPDRRADAGARTSVQGAGGALTPSGWLVDQGLDRPRPPRPEDMSQTTRFRAALLSAVAAGSIALSSASDA